MKYFIKEMTKPQKVHSLTNIAYKFIKKDDSFHTIKQTD